MSRSGLVAVLPVFESEAEEGTSWSCASTAEICFSCMLWKAAICWSECLPWKHKRMPNVQWSSSRQLLKEVVHACSATSMSIVHVHDLDRALEGEGAGDKKEVDWAGGWKNKKEEDGGSKVGVEGRLVLGKGCAWILYGTLWPESPIICEVSAFCPKFQSIWVSFRGGLIPQRLLVFSWIAESALGEACELRVEVLLEASSSPGWKAFVRARPCRARELCGGAAQGRQQP
eukprot:1139732-Pelagomonas_calceolata.AAC.2